MSAHDRIISELTPVASAIKVRASSWGRLFDCAYSWEGTHLLGISSPSGIRAQLGTAVHASTAAYDSSRLPGREPIAVDEAAAVFIDTLYNPDRDVDYSRDDMTLKEAAFIGLRLHQRYCDEISPRFEFISVEQTLKPLHIDCGGGMVVTLTGSMDRARVVKGKAGGVVIPDVKTGVRVIENGEVQTKGRSPQLGTYQLLYEATEGVQTDGGQILALSTSGKKSAMPHELVGVSEVWDAKRVMVGTETAPGLIEIAALMFKTGLFPPNTASMHCSERYCSRWATCPYHE